MSKLAFFRNTLARRTFSAPAAATTIVLPVSSVGGTTTDVYALAISFSGTGTVDLQTTDGVSLWGGPMSVTPSTLPLVEQLLGPAYYTAAVGLGIQIVTTGTATVVGFFDYLQQILFGTVAPQWVVSDFGNAFGTNPDIAFEFDQSRGWSYGLGEGQPANFLTCTRASVGYADDLSGNWNLFANNYLRITNKGLLVEEARTNSVRNNSMQGAVVGTPGTLPANWVVLNAVGGTTTTNVIATGTESGIDYIDLQIIGTAAAPGTYRIAFDTALAIAASQNQVWAMSIFTKLVGGSVSGITLPVTLGFQTYATGSVLLNSYEGGSASVGIAALGAQRSSFVATAADATTAGVRPTLTFGVPAGAYNLTLRIGWPQLELGPFATSPIRTTAAAVTRNADNITVTSPPTFGSAVSLFAAWNEPYGSTASVFRGALSLNDGTNNNKFALYNRTIDNTIRANAVVAGSGFDAANGNYAYGGAPTKAAAALAAGDFAFSAQGNAVVVSASVTGVPPSTNLLLGGLSTNSGWLNGYITRVAVWRAIRISNAGLVAGTT